MITESNFKNVLEKIGFKSDGTERFYKKYGNAEMAVDFKDKKLIYPTAQGLIVNDKTTSNFSHNENFVVFECVCRLLEKGYRAEHMELEPRWSLGHGQKSGKADILVRDRYGVDLIIIECKTTGPSTNKDDDDEFRNEEKQMKADGGQLFSYWQQSTSVKWLVLYSSDWSNGNVIIKYHVVKTLDDDGIPEVKKTYRKATTVEERFGVWVDTYEGKWFDNLIFTPESKAYEIVTPPLRKKDLSGFSSSDKVVNSFEEILRHNNVSDKENAFNRLLALFICKLVDEKERSDDEEVKFQYKQGSDNYEDLQDRLQQLHKQGMEEFMKEKITYVADNYAEDLFAQYNGKRRKEAIKSLKETIRKLKFYSNNDFAFKEVHNEELFRQNGKILVEVVRLFEKYKIIDPKEPEQQQLLGDLFEQLLNKGFKQNEGQFFTPLPITRFVWDSLPLGKYYQKLGDLPKVVDYACGAGHFLTEAIKAINAVAKKSDNAWVRDKIYGIEKDYRLARVSKISMFMNGAGDTNIIFGDGLENYPDKQVEAHSFDILVANPPYSVSGFKQHLKLKNNDFKLLEHELVTDSGSEIETLFVERIAQLLKPKGIAAVILPVALLSNNSKSYIATREQLLQNFYLRAIVSLGSNTFGATGTNTVILFLEHNDEPPCRAKLVEDCCDEIMNSAGTNLSDEWSDQEVLDDYLAHQDLVADEFRRFASKEMEIQEVKEHPYFRIYAEEFEKKNIKYPSRLTHEERRQREKEEFYKFALDIEKEKIYYFALVREQQTLVITAPSDNKEQQDFLGYKWSNRRGREGIQIISTGGKLYNNNDRFAPGTLACAIRSSFAGEDPLSSLDNELQKYAKTYRLEDMLDFSRCDFNKEVSLSAGRRNQIVQFKHPTLKLSEVWRRFKNFPKIASAEILKDGGNTPVVTQSRGKLIEGYTNTDSPIVDLPLILFGDHTCVFKYIDFKFVVGADGCVLIKADEEKVSLKFLYFYLSSLPVEDKEKYARHAKYIKNTPVPIPPKDVQEKVVSECESIDEEFNKSQAEIDFCEQKIATIFGAFNAKYTGAQTELKNLGASIVKGTSITRKATTPGEYKVVAGGTDYAYMHDEFNREPPVITVSASGSAGYVNLWRERIFASDCITIKCKTDTETVFLYYYLKSIQEFIYTLKKGGNQPHVYASDLEKILVPKISPEEQQATVNKVVSFEQQIAEARRKMDACETRKQAVLDKYLK